MTINRNLSILAGGVSSAGVLGVPNGGSGATTLTGYLIGNGAGAFTASATIPTTALSGTITNAQLANSTISGVSLGSNLFNLTAGTGVSFSAGTTYNGSTAITINATGSGGTVTSVTGTAPVVSSGGTTPAISMPVATTSVSGYLSNTDWTTFNNKQATLVSGTSIKTVNGTTLLGSGDLGIITGTYGGTGVNNGSNTITVSGNLTHAGAFTQTFTATANTSLTLPTSGYLISTVTNMTANPVTGTPSSTTFLRGDGTWATPAGGGTVTSVAASVPAFLSISGSPITTSGTLAITLSGTALPVANGGTGLTSSGASGSRLVSTGSAWATNVTPAFRAYSTVNQTIAASVQTKIQLNNASFDTNSNFDATTNYRFTPTVAGYYQINAGVFYNTASGANYVCAMIFKNGSLYATGYGFFATVGYGGAVVADIVFCNGSTDYIEFYTLQASAVSQTTSGTLYNVFMSGCLIR